MAKLEYTFKTDTLFKMLFVQNPHLLKHLVATLLDIPLGSIGQFVTTVIPEFQELERLCFYARHNEASALHHAEKIG